MKRISGSYSVIAPSVLLNKVIPHMAIAALLFTLVVFLLIASGGGWMILGCCVVVLTLVQGISERVVK